jgi:hypothetical protein
MPAKGKKRMEAWVKPGFLFLNTGHKFHGRIFSSVDVLVLNLLKVEKPSLINPSLCKMGRIRFAK